MYLSRNYLTQSTCDAVTNSDVRRNRHFAAWCYQEQVTQEVQSQLSSFFCRVIGHIKLF